MADHTDSNESPAQGHLEHESVGHIVPVKVLVATGLGLLLLTIATVAAAQVDFAAVDLPDLNIWIALAIASLKATIVCLFFMHLKWDRPFHAFVIVAAIGFVALFIVFALTDTLEYHDEIIPGDTPAIRQKLAENAAAP